jgi:hypothetical protein
MSISAIAFPQGSLALRSWISASSWRASPRRFLSRQLRGLPFNSLAGLEDHDELFEQPTFDQILQVFLMAVIECRVFGLSIWP